MVSWFTFIPHLTITWITHIPFWPTIARGKDYFSSLHHTWFLIFYKRPLLIDTLPLVSQTSSSPSFVNSLHLSVLCRYFSSVQSLTRVQLFTTPWTAAHQASLSITTPRVCSNSCPLCWWCYPTISSSVILFSSCLQFFPASGSFQMN